MPDQLQLRGGTTAETNAFTGAAREVTVDTTKKTAVVHDGSTAGGNPLLREDGSNSALALGSQGTPSLKFTGDPNTGIFSPGADQVAVSTGGTERVEWGTSEVVFNDSGADYDFRIEGDTNTALFFVDASTDRVGIGTSSPDSNLEIVNSTASADNSLLKLHSSANTSSANLIFEVNNGSTAQAGIRLDTANKLHLQTYGSGALNNVLTLSDSNVGIGTASPSAALEVVQSSDMATISATSGTSNAARHEIRSGNGTTSGKYAYIRFNNNDTNNQRYDIGTYGTDDLTFRDLKAGSTRMTLDTSGRLLVGASSSIGNAYLQVVANAGSSTGSGLVQLARGLANPASGDALGTVLFTNNAGNVAAYIEAAADGTWSGAGGSDYPGRLTFWTTSDGASSPTERMRITSDGYVKASFNGTYESSTGNSHELSAGSGNEYACYIRHKSATQPFGLNIKYTDQTADGSSNSFLQCQDPTAVRLRILSDGDVLNHDNTYGSLSDQKLKQDIVDAGSQWDDLKNLRVRKFKFISDVEAYGDNAKTLIGLVAQEAETVSPGLVKESPDLDDENNDLGTTTKSINYSVLYMKAVKALQEAMERIETLEAKVAALEAS